MTAVRRLMLFLERVAELRDSRVIQKGLQYGLTLTLDEERGMALEAQRPGKDDLRSIFGAIPKVYPKERTRIPRESVQRLREVAVELVKHQAMQFVVDTTAIIAELSWIVKEAVERQKIHDNCG